MKEILDAILADDPEAIGSIPVPESYRGITVHADEAEMFAGMPSRERIPASRCTWMTCPPRSWVRVRHWWR